MSCGRVVLYVLVGALAALFAIPAPSILSVENVDACIQASKAQKPGALPSFSLRKNAEFDVILFGATGFTGNLTARYLSRQQTHRNFTFAIAGRSQRKLDTLASSLPHPPSIFVADAGDLDALRALVRRTKVLITTAGPFADFGKLLVQACAEEGTHYADLSGEFFFQRDMIRDHHKTAQNSGAKIVVAAGYDSLPFDIGANLALSALHDADPATHKQPVSIVAGVTKSRGWLSGGTTASVKGMWADILSGNVSLSDSQDAYLLVPGADKCRVDTEASGWGVFPRYDYTLKTFGVPHFMAYVNARIVRRSMALLGHGALVSYGEGLTFGAIFDAAVFATPFLWHGHVSVMPAPGEGPPETMQRDGGFTCRVMATSSNAKTGETVSTQVDITGRGDVGYAHTSKLLAEVGLCLADVACHHASVGGGVLTTASATAVPELVRRLRAAMHEDGRPLLVFDVTSVATGSTDRPSVEL